MNSIATKLNAALKQIDVVTKSGKNQAQNYNYVKATDVANAVRKVLADVGIAFKYDVVDYERWEQAREGKSPMQFCSIKVEGTFLDTETDQTVTSTALGWGSDAGDKAPYKAMTGALKYLLRHTFIIPDESDPDNDSDDKESAVHGATARQKSNPSESDELEWSFNDKIGLLICRPVDVSERMSTGKDKRPFFAVKLNGDLLGKNMIFCWHQSMFPLLGKAQGKICKFSVSQDSKQFWSIDEVLEVDGERPPSTLATGNFDEQAFASIVNSCVTQEDINFALKSAGDDLKRVALVKYMAHSLRFEFDPKLGTYFDPKIPF
jgi:hypothetical protein